MVLKKLTYVDWLAITGAAGFIGINVVKPLSRQHTVIAGIHLSYLSEEIVENRVAHFVDAAKVIQKVWRTLAPRRGIIF